MIRCFFFQLRYDNNCFLEEYSFQSWMHTIIHTTKYNCNYKRNQNVKQARSSNFSDVSSESLFAFMRVYFSNNNKCSQLWQYFEKGKGLQDVRYSRKSQPLYRTTVKFCLHAPIPLFVFKCTRHYLVITQFGIKMYLATSNGELLIV